MYQIINNRFCVSQALAHCNLKIKSKAQSEKPE